MAFLAHTHLLLCVWSLFQFVLRYVFSRLYVLQFTKEGKASVFFLFTLFALVLSRVGLCIVSLSSHGVGQFVICNCGKS